MSGGVLTPMQRIILAAAQRQPGQYSRSGLAKLLAGSRSRRLGVLIDSPDHGRLARYSRKAITDQIDILLQQGWLGLDAYQNVIAVIAEPLDSDDGA
jgi:hypothetical protein